MNFIKIFEHFNNSNIYDGEYVLDYFKKLGSKNHSKYDNSIFNEYKQQILDNKYILKYIDIDDLLKNDIDLKEFVDTQYNYYKNKYNKVESAILIGNSNFTNDVVIDGYHRIIQNIINSDNKIKAFVPINSKY